LIGGIDRARISNFCESHGLLKYRAFFNECVFSSENCTFIESGIRGMHGRTGDDPVLPFDVARSSLEIVIERVNGMPLTQCEQELLTSVSSIWPRGVRVVSVAINAAADVLMFFYKQRFEKTPFISLPSEVRERLDVFIEQYNDSCPICGHLWLSRLMQDVFIFQHIRSVNVEFAKLAEQQVITRKALLQLLRVIILQLFNGGAVARGDYEKDENAFRRADKFSDVVEIPAHGVAWQNLGSLTTLFVALFCCEVWERALSECLTDMFGDFSEDTGDQMDEGPLAAHSG
jgi:hypothetical protein